MPPRPLTRLRKFCLGLPETTEKEAWGAPTFRVKDKLFAMYESPDSSHGTGRPAAWIKAVAENQQLMIRAKPKKYFKPPYVGPSGWIGAWIDEVADWEEIEDLLKDAWRMTAPKKMKGLVE